MEPAKASVWRGAALRWALRIGLVALVAWVLARQLQFDDAVHLRNGEVRQGRVERVSSGDGHVLLRDAQGQRQRIPTAEVAERAEGVPDVRLGISTLARRVIRQPADVALVFGILALVVFLMGVRWHRLLLAVDLPLKFRHALSLTWIGGFFNLVVPGSTGGDVIKAWYAARHTRRGTRAVCSVLVDRIMGLGMLLVVAGVALWWVRQDEALADARFVILVLWAGAAAGLVLVFVPAVRRWLGVSALARRLPFQRIWMEVSTAVGLYRRAPGTLALGLVLSLINQVAIAAVVWWLARALGLEAITLPACLALVPLTNLASALPILPGGWGVGELAFAWAFVPLGVGATEAIGLSVLYRLSFLLVNLPGGLLWILWRGETSLAAMEADVASASRSLTASPTES